MCNAGVLSQELHTKPEMGKKRSSSSYRYQIKPKISINSIADLGQKFYKILNSIPVSADLNKSPVSKMRESPVLGPCHILGLQNQIYAVS